MNQAVRKFISSTLSASIALGFSTLGLGTAFAAGQLTHNSISLSDDRISTSNNYTFQFNAATAATVKSIVLQFSQTPSGGVTLPHNLDTTGATTTSVSVAGSVDANWSGLNKTTNGTLILSNSTGTAVGAANTVIVVMNSITNNDVASHCDGIALNTTDTCYVQIATYNSDTTQNSTTLVDTGVSSYTVVTPITAQATVDPILNFVVTGVTGSNITSNDANAADTGGAATTSVTTTPTSIPFGNVGVGKAKVAQQQLAVQTNANNGYNVYAKFAGTQIGGSGSAYMMAGTQASNKLDPFTASTATWSAPKVFIAPTSTTTNTNSGWCGMRTNNLTVTGGTVPNFGTVNYFAPPAFGAGIGNAVMTDLGPDNGTSPTSVTYKIAVDAYQPADQYTGTVVYSAVASY